MGAIDIWHVDLAAPAGDPPGVPLTADETIRASRLHGEEMRDRWVRSRLALRAVLAAYAGRHGPELRFGYGPFGKPRLEPVDRNGAALHFSLTRSGDLCLIAVSRDHQLGIDVERIGGEGGEDAIARRFFARREAAAIDALDSERKARAFLAIWTRKEAYTKAIGLGLQHPLSDFDILPDGAGRAAAHGGGLAAWRLIPLELPPGFVGTLAAEERHLATPAPIEVSHFAFNPRAADASAGAIKPITCDMLQERAS